MRSNKKCRFINLAEQLASQNAVVSSTMDSLLVTVAAESGVQQRTDWAEIEKTAQSAKIIDRHESPNSELDPGIFIPKPKQSGSASQPSDVTL